jgi:hypothetical protein
MMEIRMNPLVAYLLARLREPSTYAGLGGLFAAFGLHPNAEVIGAIVNAAVAAAGLAAVLIPEARHNPTPSPAA